LLQSFTLDHLFVKVPLLNKEIAKGPFQSLTQSATFYYLSNHLKARCIAFQCRL